MDELFFTGGLHELFCRICMNMLFVSALLLVRNESKEFTIASTRMNTERGDWTDKRFLFALFLFFIYYNIFTNFGQIYWYGWACGLVRPLQGGAIENGLVRQLQGGTIETDKLDRYKGGAYGARVSRSPFFESVFFTQSLLRAGLIRII